MELSKKDTKMMQSLSVVAMLCLHLFDRWNYSELYQPLIYIFDLPLSFYLGHFGDFCVMGFAFCSGYAHMVQYRNAADKKALYRHRLIGLLKLYINYWIILLLFTPLSLLMGNAERMPGSAWDVVLNFTGLNTSYNGACWYLLTYAIIVIISPLLLKITQKRFLIVNAIAFLAVYLAAFYIRFQLPHNSWALDQFGKLGMTLFEYMMGVYCVKLGVFDKIQKAVRRLPIIALNVLLLLVVFAAVYARAKIIPSVVFAPISGFLFLTAFWLWNKPRFVEKSLLFVGKHSTNIWLVHMFFYASIFDKLVFVAAIRLQFWHSCCF